MYLHFCILIWLFFLLPFFLKFYTCARQNCFFKIFFPSSFVSLFLLPKILQWYKAELCYHSLPPESSTNMIQNWMQGMGWVGAVLKLMLVQMTSCGSRPQLNRNAPLRRSFQRLRAGLLGSGKGVDIPGLLQSPFTAQHIQSVGSGSKIMSWFYCESVLLFRWFLSLYVSVSYQ